MPIYEYKCKDCGKISEFLVGVGEDAPEIKCRFCKSKRLKKFSLKFLSLQVVILLVRKVVKPVVVGQKDAIHRLVQMAGSVEDDLHTLDSIN